MANWYHTSFYTSDVDVIKLIKDNGFEFKYDEDRFCGYCELKYGIGTINLETLEKVATRNKSTFTIFASESTNGIDQKLKFVNGIKTESKNEQIKGYRNDEMVDETFMIDDILSIRGLNYELNLVKDDRYQIFYNEEHNVTIFAIPYCKDELVSDVFNGISDNAYWRIINFMNENNNLIIKWTKVEGTTSDYTVYCDADYDGDWNIIDLEEYLWTLDFGEKSIGYKYNICKDGETTRFKD